MISMLFDLALCILSAVVTFENVVRISRQRIKQDLDNQFVRAAIQKIELKLIFSINISSLVILRH